MALGSQLGGRRVRPSEFVEIELKVAYGGQWYLANVRWGGDLHLSESLGAFETFEAFRRMEGLVL